MCHLLDPPARMTPTRSAIESASSWSWVTNSVVISSRAAGHGSARAAARAPWRRGRRAARRAGGPRLDGQRAGQGYPLLLPAGHLVRVLRSAEAEADQLEVLPAPGPACRLVLLAHAQAEGHVLLGASCSGRGCSSGRPCPCRAAGPGCGESWPLTRIRAGTGRLETRQDPSAVVLPQPDGPRRATNSPGWRVRVNPSSAWVAPKRRREPESRCDGCAAVPCPLGVVVMIRRPFLVWAIRRIRRRSNDEITISSQPGTTSDNKETAVEIPSILGESVDPHRYRLVQVQARHGELAEHEGDGQHRGREYAGAQVGDDHAPQGRAPPAAEGSGRFDQRLAGRWPASPHRGSGRRRAWRGWCTRAPAGRACSSRRWGPPATRRR